MNKQVIALRNNRAGESSLSGMHQRQVDDYFRVDAIAWKQIYERADVDVYAAIHRQRRNRVHALVDELSLRPGARVLEVGCGAGSTAVALAQRAYTVTAIDRVPEMVAIARQAAEQAGLKGRIATLAGDIHHLAFPNASFDLVLAIGVLPWLASLGEPLREMARVLAPGGYLIANVDNRLGLHRMFDPKTNFLLAPLRRALREAFSPRKARDLSPSFSMCSTAAFDRVLDQCGFYRLKAVYLGFGPFSLLGRELLPRSFGIKLNNCLQELADRGIHPVRALGAQYLAVAQKLQ